MSIHGTMSEVVNLSESEGVRLEHVKTRRTGTSRGLRGKQESLLLRTSAFA